MTTYRALHLSVNLLMLIMLCSFTFVNTDKIRNDLKMHRNWNILPGENECGYSSSDRIIGGSAAPLGKYPWIVRLKYIIDKYEEIFACAGTIISQRYILTAAHCGPEVLGNGYDPEYINLVTVHLGENKISTYIDCENGVCAPPVQEVKVESHFCHEYFIEEQYHNDICIVRTAEPIVFSDFVYPICLPYYDSFLSQSYVGYKMEVAGWGIDNIATRSSSDNLEVVVVPVIDIGTCRNLTDDYDDVKVITRNQICAGGSIGFDSCGGDSGGPMMKPYSIDSPPRYFIIGVVSYGPTRCGATKIPGLYTRVDKYLTWILDNIRE